MRNKELTRRFRVCKKGATSAQTDEQKAMAGPDHYALVITV